MNQLRKNLKALAKSLNQLTRQTEKMAKRLDKLEKAPPAKKRKRKPAVKAKPAKKTGKAKSAKKVVKAPKATSIDQILALLSESGKHIDINALKEKTDISDNNLRASLYRLRKRGLIKSAGRGVYVRS